MASLDKVLKDIARGAPNHWSEVTEPDFSTKYDYIIQRHGSWTIIDPVSRAAVEWAYAHFPDDCPRYGVGAWMIESKYTAAIFERMAEDGLMSDEEYEYSMSCEDRDVHAGERG